MIHTATLGARFLLLWQDHQSIKSMCVFVLLLATLQPGAKHF